MIRRNLPFQNANSNRYQGPGLSDWSLLGLGVAFVICGLVLLPSKPDVAVPCLALFGVCTLVFGANVLRKRRFARTRLLTVEIVGGTRIRPLRARVAVVGTTLLGLGVV